MNAVEEWRNQVQGKRNAVFDEMIDRIVDKLQKSGNIIMASSEDIANHVLHGGAFKTETQPDGKIKIIYIRPEDL